MWHCYVRAGSDALDEHCEALADPDAQGRETTPRILALHPPEQRDGQPRTAAAERVPESDRTAVGVDRLDVEPQPADTGQHLRSERLVDLDGVKIVGGPAGARERLLAGRHRTQTHQVRRHTGATAGDDPRAWLQVVATYGVLARHNDRGRSGGEGGGRAGVHDAAVGEEGAQLAEPVERR